MAPAKRSTQYSPFFVLNRFEKGFRKLTDEQADFAQGGSFRFERIVSLVEAHCVQKLFWQNADGKEYPICVAKLEFIKKSKSVVPYTGKALFPYTKREERVFLLIQDPETLEGAGEYMSRVLLHHTQLSLQTILGDEAKFKEDAEAQLKELRVKGKEAFTPEKVKRVAPSASRIAKRTTEGLPEDEHEAIQMDPSALLGQLGATSAGAQDASEEEEKPKAKASAKKEAEAEEMAEA